jgi:hypothetical protein
MFVFSSDGSKGSSIREDKFCRSVRTLMDYLDRMTSIATNDQLFLTHAEPHGQAAIRALTRWTV